MLKEFKTCVTCFDNMCLRSPENHSSIHLFTELKEYNTSSYALKYCTETFMSTLMQISNVCTFLLPKIFHLPNLGSYFHTLLAPHILFSFNNCDHSENLKASVLTSFISFLLYNYSNRLNQILSRKQTNVFNPDPLKKQCMEIVRKKSSFRK